MFSDSSSRHRDRKPEIFKLSGQNDSNGGSGKHNLDQSVDTIQKQLITHMQHITEMQNTMIAQLCQVHEHGRQITQLAGQVKNVSQNSGSATSKVSD
eukprot:1684597-Pyramimonas_sp.AAC.1